MEIGFFGKMMNKCVKMVQKNFIDIKFLSIAVLILLFTSLLVFKVGVFKEGMGVSYIAGEAPLQELVVDDDTVIGDQETSGEVTDVSAKDAPIPDIAEPCALCGVECPNKDNACLSSKPSCVSCQEKITDKLTNKNNSTPIVVNVYTGGDGEEGEEGEERRRRRRRWRRGVGGVGGVGWGGGGVKGAESSTVVKNANTNLGALTGNSGLGPYASADATGMAQDINNINVNDMVDNEQMEANKKIDESSLDESGGGAVIAGEDTFVNGMGIYGDVKPKTIYPSMSYSILSPAQQEIDEMNNL